MKNPIKALFQIIIFIVLIQNTYAQRIDFQGGESVIGKHIEIYEDKENEYDINSIRTVSDFVKSTVSTPNMGQSRSSYWIKFKLKNKTKANTLYLELAYPLIHTCELYAINGNDITSTKLSKNDNFYKRVIKHENLIFPLQVNQNETLEVYLKVEGESHVILPLIIRDQTNLFESSLLIETINGIYAGIILVMILYNIFIYFSTRDKNYLYYVLYILFIGLAQTALSGFSYKYIWPSYPHFNANAVIWFSVLAGIFAVFFFKNFLQVKEKLPIGNLLLNGMLALYVITGLINLFGFTRLSFYGVDVSGVYAGIATLYVAYKIARQNYRPAIIFLLAWSIFIIGLILLVLRNFNVLPYSYLTSYTMQTGTILEVILLSFALADKINILKIEREFSQKRELEVFKENERIIGERNRFLDDMVKKRTEELSTTNVNLQDAMYQLKDAQTQLIESEKMASLGQLTAGIAHEINNPINFVSSNVRPLRRDIEDILTVLDAYEKLEVVSESTEFTKEFVKINKLKDKLDINYIKTELDMLLTGMEDGAKRTVEIVKGLKIFSRVDEADLNEVNINEGLESTLVILNYQIGSEIKLVKNLEDLPKIECYGGKLNQVFMNILTNSIYALKNRENSTIPNELHVTTWRKNEDQICISLKDNGDGIPPEVKNKIFDPFFTTKQIGEGTGLGLSIVFKIIDAHNGSIQVNSEVGSGTEFLITLPILRKKP